MLENLSLNKAQREQHVKCLKELGESFPSIVEPLLTQIKVLSAITFMYSPELLYSMEKTYQAKPQNLSALVKNLNQQALSEVQHKSANTPLPPAFIDSQKEQHRAIMPLVITLGATLFTHRPSLIEVNAKAYFQGHGYLLLLGSLISYNLAQFSALENNHKDKDSYLNKCIDWMTIFETDCLPELDYDFCIALRSMLAKKIKDLKVAPRKVPLQDEAYSNPTLLVDELRQLVNHKNKSAMHNGIPCKRMVIQAPSSALYSIDLNTLDLLRAELSKIINTKITEPRHFLFYCNQELGPVELLSVNYNKDNNQVDLISVSSGNNISQYYFLVSLSLFMESNQVPYRLLACQADLQPTETCSQFYAYLLSGILASKTFDSLIPVKTMPQPAFYDPHEKTILETERLKTVRWFSIEKLGDKALLLAPTHEKRQALFKKLHGITAGLQRYQFYSRKYQLLNQDYFTGAFHHYYEYAYHRAKIFFADRDVIAKSAKNFTLESARRRPTLLEIEQLVCSEEFDTQNEDELLAVAQELENLRGKLEGLKLAAADERAKLKPLPAVFLNLHVDLAASERLHQRNAKVLRRAAAGYCPLSWFAELLNQPSTNPVIDEFDPEQKYNPLQLALIKQQPKRALMLLAADADREVVNGEGKTAKMIYAELPADSPVKRNKKLGALLGTP